MSSFLDKYWLIIAAVLLICFITGAAFLAVRFSQLQPVEITLRDSAAKAPMGDIFIGGAVSKPGMYPLKNDDTLTTAVNSAGILENSDLSRIKIYIPSKGESIPEQKISLNSAGDWLLQSLPGIGEGKARAIIDYRTKNGPFRSVDDLLKIEGFGKAIVDKIRGLVSVEE
jgi:competence protein ComEA